MDAARLDALARKLRHDLPKIRLRALKSLRLKLRERLVRASELEPLQGTLIPALLECVQDPNLELEALHVLQLLVQSGSTVLLSSLQYFKAAQKLQRAANRNEQLQESYEKLLAQIYVTKFAEEKEEVQEQVEAVTEHVEKMTTAVLDARRAPQLQELEARGWRFAQVVLASVDEQYLFEFEVKLRLRTQTEEIVAACAVFRNELLRNFPAEVFLQRPAMLQYLLHLVQQPILPDSPATAVGTGKSSSAEWLMEKAMEVSLGVNYFDDMFNPTFSQKRGNFSGAVVMAAIKAIESFVTSLRRTRKTCLDPTYVSHRPKVHVELYDAYDARRGLYPQSHLDINDREKGKRSDGTDGGSREQYSHGGAIYKIFISLLPLLRSSKHPRLHVLNLLIRILPDIMEQSHCDTDMQVQALDKARLEHIFEVLIGICRPPTFETADTIVMDAELELTHSMAWKLVELVLRLLQLYPSSNYKVEDGLDETITVKESSSPTDNRNVILVPKRLWQAVKYWITNPMFAQLAAQEWADEALVQCLSEIDSTIPAFINLKHSAQRDAKMVLQFVEFARAHRQQLLDFSSWDKPSFFNLDVATKVIQGKHVFAEDAEAIAEAVIQTICALLTTISESGEEEFISDSDIEAIRFVLCSYFVDTHVESQAKIPRDVSTTSLFRCLKDLIDELSADATRFSLNCRRQLVTDVLCEPKFFTLSLLSLTEKSWEQDSGASLWGVLHWALDQLSGVFSDTLMTLQPVIPLLQHFAYVEPSEKSTSEQRLTQPQLAEILNRLETVVPGSARPLLMARCLLHQSSYIRKAGASGLLRLISTGQPSAAFITQSKDTREDPFGCTFTQNGREATLESELIATPLPVIHRSSQYHPSENELGSQLNKLSHLCKVASGSASALKEAALKELVMVMEYASVELFSLFEEVDKLSGLVDQLRTILRAEDQGQGDGVIYQALVVLKTLLLRSRLLRSAMQHDGDMIALLLPLVYHSSASIRAQMYYIFLLLTCSSESFAGAKLPAVCAVGESDESSTEAVIPEVLKSTFGLYSSSWTKCSVPTCSLTQQLRACGALVLQRVDSSLISKILGIVHRQKPDHLELEHSGDDLLASLSAEYNVAAQRLRGALSHGKCLNALYHLMTVCEAWSVARSKFVGEWEVDFERYLAVPPKNERDELIVGSLVSCLSIVFGSMSRGEQLRVLLVVKRKILPLLKKSESKVFSLQVARLLLNVSASKVGDLFLSLAADTDIIATICTKYSTVYATEPVLHGLMLEVLSRFAVGVREDTSNHLSKPSREKICKRLLEMLSPLLTVVCRHRVPGSFLERDAFVAGSQCMVSILQTLPRQSLLTSDSPLQHTDSNLLLDGNWASRFLFDHVAPIRELGFIAIEQAVSADPVPTTLLEMALETATNDTEPDAVRAAACCVLTKEILQFNESSDDRQVQLVEAFHGTKFAGQFLNALSLTLKSDTVFVRSASRFARLVRALYTHSATLSPQFGDMKKELDDAEDNDDIYAPLIQVLSLRDWKRKCDRFCSFSMLVSGCRTDVWRISVLPAALDLMVEVLSLIQAMIQENGDEHVTFLLTHTSLQYQLMELVRDVHASLSKDAISTKHKHYQVFDSCAITLCLLLTRYGGNSQIDAPTASGFGASFTEVAAQLLDAQHPTNFRISFSRVVPALILLMPNILDASDPATVRALCSAVFELYQEVAEFRPLDTITSTTAQTELHGRIFSVASIRRVSSALQVMLESHPDMRQLVLMKQGMSFAISSIKESFAAVRVAGGFGGKRTRASDTSQDAYVLDLCERIQTHMNVARSLLGDDKEQQRIAKNEGLLAIISANWSIMKMAHVRGSQLLLTALRLIGNYSFGNDSSKGSILASLPPMPRNSKGDTSQTLLSSLFDLASNRGSVTASHRRSSGISATDVALSNAACQVLQSILLNAECVSASVKAGSISRLVDALQHRLQLTRQTSKTDRLEFENLAYMLSVASSVASMEEGARVLYASCATMLSPLVDDVIHSSSEGVRRNGCLFLRNLALSQATKNNFAFWEELLDELVAASVRERESDSRTLEYLSTALWSLVYDNQKARALLLSKPAVLQSLQQMLDLTGTSKVVSKGVAENLRRVLLLVRE